MQSEGLSENIKQYISAESKSLEEVESLNQILLCVSSNQVTLLNLFSELQEYFTSTALNIRAKGTQLILEIFRRLTDLKIDYSHFQALTKFFIYKLNDIAAVCESSGVIRVLFERYITQFRIEASFMEIILMFTKQIQSDQFYVPQYQQEVRMNIYRIIQVITEQVPQIVKENLKSGFVAMLLRVTENERDPRNILIVFSLFDFVLRELDGYEQFKSAIFEQLDCYYPIEFNEKADQRFSITQKQLNDALNKCFSNLLLIDLVIPEIEEKLLSAHIPAQIAALDTFAQIYIQNLNNLNQIPTMSQNKSWNMLDNYLELNIETEVYESLKNAVKSFVIYLEKNQKTEFIHKIIARFINNLQSQLLSDIANVSLDILLECFKISEQIQIHTCSLLIKQFIQGLSSKDPQYQQKRIQVILKTLQFLTNNNLQLNLSTQALIENCILTLQESLSSQVENSIILGIRTLMELNMLISKQHQFLKEFDNIHTIVLNMISNQESSISLKKCCIDYFSVVQLSSQALNNFENIVTQNTEVFVYAIPTIFQLFPQKFQIAKEELQKLFGDIQSQEKIHQYYMVPLIIFFRRIISNTQYTMNLENLVFFLNVFSIHRTKLNKENLNATYALIKLIAQKLESQSNVQAYHTFIFNLAEQIINQDDKLPYFLLLLDSIKIDDIEGQDFYNQLLFKIWQNLSQITFEENQKQRNDDNSKYYSKLLKKILLVHIHILNNPPIMENLQEKQNKVSQSGFTQFSFTMTFLKIGLALGLPQYLMLVDKLLNEHIKSEDQEFLKAFIINLILKNKKLQKLSNYSMWIMDHIVRKLLVNCKNEYVKADIYFEVLSKLDLSILLYYDDLWNSTIDLAKTSISLIENPDKIKQIIETVLNLSRVSKYQINVVPFLTEVLQIKLSFKILNEILMAFALNAHLAQQQKEAQFKQSIKQIQLFLDHPKRQVRRGAQFAINEWYLSYGKGL